MEKGDIGGERNGERGILGENERETKWRRGYMIRWRKVGEK